MLEATRETIFLQNLFQGILGTPLVFPVYLMQSPTPPLAQQPAIRVMEENFVAPDRFATTKVNTVIAENLQHWRPQLR